MKSKLPIVDSRYTVRVLKDIYRILNRKDITVSFAHLHREQPRLRGFCQPYFSLKNENSNSFYTAEICIDPKENVLSVFIHECLHFLHPTWSEYQVEGMERRIAKELSIDQSKELILKLAAALR